MSPRADVVSDADRHELVQATDLNQRITAVRHQLLQNTQRWTGPFEASEGIPYDSQVTAAEGDRVGVVAEVPDDPSLRTA
jgi:hypothetical protein